MLIKRNADGKLKLTQVARNIVAMASVIGVISGGLYFMEDRYCKNTAAAEIKSSIEADAVKTFQMQQQVLKIEHEALKKEIDTKQKALDQKYDIEHLNDLRDHKLFLKKELERDPNNALVKERLEIIVNKIEKLEIKVYGE